MLCVQRVLPEFSDPYHPHSWIYNWMFSPQLGKLIVVLAAEKIHSESHSGSSRHLTLSDMYHFGSLFFPQKTIYKATPN